MKKTLILILCVITLTIGVTFADNPVKVTYADYPISINGQSIDNHWLPYPFLVYHQVTYVPLTWDFTQALSLSTAFDSHDGLNVSVSAQNAQINQSITYSDTYRSLESTTFAEFPSFPVIINQEPLSDLNSPYPVLVYQGITYLPLTYDFMVNKCQIQYTFDSQEGLALKTANSMTPPSLDPFEEDVTETSDDKNKENSLSGYIDPSTSVSPLPTHYQTYEALGYSADDFIRDQGEDNTCWAFSSNTLFEISLLKRFNTVYNLNEDQLIQNTPIPADKDSGGYYDMAAGYYLQNATPFDDISGQVIPYRLMGYFSIDDNVKAIKQAILTYGAGLSSIYLDQDYSPDKDAIYRTSQLDKSMINHDVVLIGWDDSKKAYIAQNSWGKNWGNQGLFYIAYDDQFINQKVTFMTDIISRDDLNILTYTPTGITHYNNLNDAHSITGLNVFPLESNQTIDEVGFYVGAQDTSVVISIAEDASHLEELTSLGHMIIPYAGYYSYQLTQPITIDEAESIGIAVNYNHASESFLLPVEAPYPQIEYSVAGHSGESYILMGSLFKDLTNYKRDANIGINLYYSPASNDSY